MALAWDAVDSPPDEAVEPRTGSGGHSGTPGTATDDLSGFQVRPSETALARLRMAELHCDCRTPWDAEPPSLLLADSPSGPVRQMFPLSTKPGADVRAEARAKLDTLGHSLVTIKRSAEVWRDGRHTLLPPADPGSRIKTRPGWLAALADGGVAVVDVPSAPAGGGVHCGDCHRNFANAGAHQLHKRDWAAPCKDPATVITVVGVTVEPGRMDLCGRLVASRLMGVQRGVPMLKRGLAGIWGVDPMAVWGADGPAMSPVDALRVWQRGQDRLSAQPRWWFGQGANRVAADLTGAVRS